VKSLLEQQSKMVLGLVARAQNVFGGTTSPAEPPQFAAPLDLEDDLGKGFFGTHAIRSGAATPRSARSDGDNDHPDSGDGFDVDVDVDVADRLIAGAAPWARVGGGSGTRR